VIRSIRDLTGARICATNGEIGRVEELLFDDERWTVRYMVVDAQAWLAERRVLLSPRAVVAVDWDAQTLYLNLRQQQVQDAPHIAIDQPLSRRIETRFNSYYAYPPYWIGDGVWGMGTHPYTYGGFSTAPNHAARAAPHPGRPSIATRHQRNDTQDALRDAIPTSYLRRIRSLRDYPIYADDDAIGYVEDVLFDDETWAIRYLVAATPSVWSGSNLLVARTWVTSVDWVGSRLDLDVAGEAVRQSPPFERTLLDRDYEAKLHRHYARRGYWE
jgi:sporulation protein YlmC with PRC-barrel domain